MLSRNPSGGNTNARLLFLLVFLVIPLRFVFACPSMLFTSPAGKSRTIFVILNVIGAASTIFFFPRLAALPFPNNPVRDVHPIAVLIALIIALPVFLVALFFKNRSSVAILASVLFWAYIPFLALVTLDRFFYESPLYATFYFLCFVSPAILAFAAGTLHHYPKFGHSLALLAGAWTLTWLFWVELRDSELENAWIMFNVPDKDIGSYPVLHAELTILAIALIVVTSATATLGLLPPHWRFRKLPLCNRIWPAFALSFMVLAFWFSQSVMPYRIPGALDSDYPILGILHVEKGGLQFHETSISVFRHYSFYVSQNDRRLLQYRFQQESSWGQLPEALMRRVQDTVQSPDFAKRDSSIIKPIRTWNADGWYLLVERSGFHPYTSDAGTTLPQEIVPLFHALEAAPRSPVTQTARKDVCLGFCYDPLSGLGRLYSNHRCFNDGKGFHCG